MSTEELAFFHTCVNGMLDSFESLNLTTIQIAIHLESLNSFVRDEIILTAIQSYDPKLAKRVIDANEIIKQKRMCAFKRAMMNGTQEEFLAKMSWSEKLELKVKLGLSRLDYNEDQSLNAEQQSFSDIIEQSIQNELNPTIGAR